MYRHVGAHAAGEGHGAACHAWGLLHIIRLERGSSSNKAGGFKKCSVQRAILSAGLEGGPSCGSVRSNAVRRPAAATCGAALPLVRRPGSHLAVAAVGEGWGSTGWDAGAECDQGLTEGMPSYVLAPKRAPSSPQQGTTSSLHLPCLTACDTDLQYRASPQRAQSLSPTAQRRQPQHCMLASRASAAEAAASMAAPAAFPRLARRPRR